MDRISYLNNNVDTAVVNLLDLQGWNPWFGSLRQNNGLAERSHLVSSDASVNAKECIVCYINLDKGIEMMLQLFSSWLIK